MDHVSQHKPRAFTVKYDSRSNAILTPVIIAKPFDPTTPGPHPQLQHQFGAIWDTGATKSVITDKVVQACGLAPTGIAKVHGVHGASFTETYFVSVFLPNKVVIPQVNVTKGQLIGNADVLIGMDIITTGDFAITNKDGKTTMSFCIPSRDEIDFLHSQPSSPVGSDKPKVSRSAPCPCGSGKKYKRCCGK